MAGNDGSQLELTPAAGDGVDVGSTAATVGDLDLDVLGAERAGVVGPGLQVGSAGGGPAGEGGGLVFAGSVLTGSHCMYLYVVMVCVCGIRMKEAGRRVKPALI